MLGEYMYVCVRVGGEGRLVTCGDMGIVAIPAEGYRLPLQDKGLRFHGNA
jgi:hypothetical protein